MLFLCIETLHIPLPAKYHYLLTIIPDPGWSGIETGAINIHHATDLFITIQILGLQNAYTVNCVTDPVDLL